MKVFVIVGSQIPFDRLISAIEHWAGSHPEVEVFGQIGRSKLALTHIKFIDKLVTREFNNQFKEADLIISHAGMGVILKALEMNKPLLVVPRQVALHECTTDHQLATAKTMKKLDYVHVAMDTNEMIGLLNDPVLLKPKHTIKNHASDQLLQTLTSFINEA